MLRHMSSLFVLCYDMLHVACGIVCAVVESIYFIFKPPAMKPVEGEVVLIVNAGSGVGRALALELASLGAMVVCWHTNQETWDTAGHCAGQIHAYHCDISSREQVASAARRVQKEVGNVSVLIHCGGVQSPAMSLRQLTMERSSAMAIDFFSHFWVLQELLPAMMRRQQGHVVLLSSVAGLSGAKEQVGLRTAQFAVQGLAESLQEELRVSRCRGVHLTLAHVHPSILLGSTCPAHRVPRYFGVAGPTEAASQIVKAMRRNQPEVSIPYYLFYLGNIFRVLPPKASKMLREFLDTAVEAC